MGTWSRPTCDLQPVGLWPDPKIERNSYSKLRLIVPILFCTSLWHQLSACLRQDKTELERLLKQSRHLPFTRKVKAKVLQSRKVGDRSSSYFLVLRRAKPSDVAPWEICYCSLAKSALCDLMDCSMPHFLVLHYLPKFAQTQVHWVDDIIQPSHPLSPPFPPAFNLSQHQGLF